MSASSNVLYQPVSLPNEGPPQPSAVADPVAVSAPKPQRVTPFRLALLGGGVLLAAGGAFVLPQLAARNSFDPSSIRLPAPVQLSRMGMPPAPEPEPEPVPAPDAPAPSATQPASTSLADEIAGLGAPVPSPAPAVAAPVPGPTPLAMAAPDPVAAAGPAPMPPSSVTTTDPVGTALKLVPAPTSSAEEVSLLGLVTAIATELRTSREDNAALRDQVRALSASLDRRLEDLERRTRLHEAQNAVAGMQAPSMSAAEPQAAPEAPRTVLTVTAQPYGWRVQGGSPRMAVLAPTGSGPIKVVRVGDAIDERLGKVERIYQDGRLWVVQAEHGSVRGGE